MYIYANVDAVIFFVMYDKSSLNNYFLFCLLLKCEEKNHCDNFHH